MPDTMTLDEFGEYLAGEMAKPAFQEIVAASREKKPNAADEYFDAISDVVEAHPITLGVRRGKSET